MKFLCLTPLLLLLLTLLPPASRCQLWAKRGDRWRSYVTMTGFITRQRRDGSGGGGFIPTMKRCQNEGQVSRRECIQDLMAERDVDLDRSFLSRVRRGQKAALDCDRFAGEAEDCLGHCECASNKCEDKRCTAVPSIDTDIQPEHNSGDADNDEEITEDSNDGSDNSEDANNDSEDSKNEAENTDDHEDESEDDSDNPTTSIPDEFDDDHTSKVENNQDSDGADDSTDDDLDNDDSSDEDNEEPDEEDGDQNSNDVNAMPEPDDTEEIADSGNADLNSEVSYDWKDVVARAARDTSLDHYLHDTVRDTEFDSSYGIAGSLVQNIEDV